MGMQCELRDNFGLGGTAQLAGWTDMFVSFTNLSSGFEVSAVTDVCHGEPRN